MSITIWCILYMIVFPFFSVRQIEVETVSSVSEHLMPECNVHDLEILYYVFSVFQYYKHLQQLCIVCIAFGHIFSPFSNIKNGPGHFWQYSKMILKPSFTWPNLWNGPLVLHISYWTIGDSEYDMYCTMQVKLLKYPCFKS